MDEVKGCGWLVQVDAVAYHNRNYDEMVAAMSDEELDEYGPPEPWYPDFPGDQYVVIECGGEVVGERGLCAGHDEAMSLPGLEFEDALRRGVTWSGDHTPYD